MGITNRIELKKEVRRSSSGRGISICFLILFYFKWIVGIKKEYDLSPRLSIGFPFMELKL